MSSTPLKTAALLAPHSTAKPKKARPREANPLPPAERGALDTAASTAYLGIGRTHFLALVRTGEIARPIKSGRCSRWLRRDLDGYIERLAAARDAAARQGGK